MSQSKSDNRKPLLTNGDNSHPDSSRSTSVDIGRRDKDVTDGPVVPAPPAGCAARMHAYKACLFVMCTMTGVSIVYGGFSAVVAVFLHEQLGLPERWATFAVNMFGVVNFSMAIVGGLLSDRVMGQYGTIIVGVTCNIVGATLLVITTAVGLGSLTVLRIVTAFAMLGVAMGNGISATVLSTYIGTQYRGHPSHLPSVYRWFYITFNGGVVLAALGTPALTTYASPTAGFVVLGACGVAALLVFLAGTSLYKSSTLVTVAVTPSPAPKNWTPQPSPRLTLAAIRRRVCCRVPKTTARERRKLWAVAKIYMPFVVFWALFFNIYGFWTFSALGMDRRIGSYEIPAGQMTALNPMIDICIIPIFDLVVYPTYERVMGRPLSPIARMTIGMGFTAASLVAAGLVQTFQNDAMSRGSALHVAWQVPQYFFLSCGEVMASITGLEFAFTQAPDGFRGAVMAGWFLTQGGGNAVVAIVALVVNASSNVSPFVYFGFAAFMVLVMAFFMCVSRGYHYQKQQHRRSHVPAPRRGPPVSAPHANGKASHPKPVRQRSNSGGSR